MTWRWALGLGLALLGCGDPPPPRAAEPPEVTVAPRDSKGQAEDDGARDDEREPAVPEAVSAFHEKAFALAVDPELGAPLWVVTLHGDAYERAPGADAYHCLVLFESGLIGTWRQRSAAPRDQFFTAKMTAAERDRTKERIEAVAEKLASVPPQEPPVRGTILGVSARAAEGVVTRYFDLEALPPEVGRLVGELKHRLEATNGPQ